MFRILLAISVVLVGCSRLGLGTSLNISTPFHSDQGGFAADDMLKKTVVQIHIPGRPAPIVRVTNYQPGEVPRGQDFSMDLANVPKGTGYLIQFLAIYENTTHGALRFFYGDATSSVGANTSVEITADNVGISDALVRAAGRYLTGPDIGPTGTLIAEFQPPNGKPTMKAGEYPITNGWFSVKGFISDIAQLRYYVAGTSTVLFNNLAPDAPELRRLNATLMKILKPVSYHLANGQVQVTPESEIFVGFWGQNAGQQICYIATNEVVLGEFYDQNLTQALEFRSSLATGQNVRVAGGGVPQSYASYPTSSCTARFEHQGAAGDALVTQ